MPSPVVILVDDDRATRELLIDVLEGELGAAVSAFGDGRLALDLVRTIRPDVIVLDWGLPVLGGADVARLVRADPETAGIPIVCMTALSRTPELEAAMSACTAVVWKPFELDHLVDVLRRVLVVE